MLLKEIVATGATVEEARIKAVELLGVHDGEEVEYEVLDAGRPKVLGIFGGSPAKVRAFVRRSPADVAKAYLEKILDKMNVKARLTVEEGEEGAYIRLEGDDLTGMLIGRRGETLDALQYLCCLAANQQTEKYYRITLNAGEYREKREKTLEALAKRVSKSALRSGRSVTLDPMSSYERRIIHTAVQKIEGVTSWSVGEGESRRVIIGVSKDAKPAGDKSRSGNRRRRPPARGKKPAGSAPAASAAQREPVKDLSSAPLYGRIDT